MDFSWKHLESFVLKDLIEILITSVSGNLFYNRSWWISSKLSMEGMLWSKPFTTTVLILLFVPESVLTMMGCQGCTIKGGMKILSQYQYKQVKSILWNADKAGMPGVSDQESSFQVLGFRVPTSEFSLRSINWETGCGFLQLNLL